MKKNTSNQTQEKIIASASEAIQIESIGSDISVAIIQISTPFFNELDIGQDPRDASKKVCYWRDSEHRTKKITRIAKEILSRYSRIDFMVFPEYSVPQSSWDDLKIIADNHKVIIVGGSDYHGGLNKNVCPVFLPGQQPHYLVKSSKSYYETDIYFSSSPIKENRYHNGIITIEWETDGKRHDIQAVLCSDFLQHGDRIHRRNVGLIVCPASSPQMRRFYGYADFLTGLDTPKYVLFANTVSSLLSPVKMAGTSGICCSLPEEVSDYPKLDSRNESVLYAQLHLASPRRETPKGVGSLKPISNIEYVPIRYENDEYVLGNSCSYDNVQKRAILNPDIFRVLGKKLRFFYMRCENYGKAMEELQKSDTFSASVLGNVDVIIKNINDASVNTKLYDLNNAARYFKDTSWNYFSVDRFIKFDGILVRSGINAIEDTPSKDDIVSLIALATGVVKKDREKACQKAEERKWLIGEVYECEDDSNVRAVINIILPDAGANNV